MEENKMNVFSISILKYSQEIEKKVGNICGIVTDTFDWDSQLSNSHK
jgi:hypothetical protein